MSHNDMPDEPRDRALIPSTKLDLQANGSYAWRFIKQVIKGTLETSVRQQALMFGTVTIITVLVHAQQGLITSELSVVYLRAALWIVGITIAIILLLNILRAPFILDSEQRKRIAGLQARLIATERRQLQGSNPRPAPRVPQVDEGQTRKAEPNFVCREDYCRAHVRSNILKEGYLEGAANEHFNAVAIVAEITNEFTPSRKVDSVSEVSAEIFYQTPSGVSHKVNRGSWLSESAYRLIFDVNATYRLIIAFAPPRQKPHVFTLLREWTTPNDAIENRIGLLDEDFYNIKVRLIKESAGIVYKEFDFTLTLTREPEFDYELTQVRELTPKEIRQQLEAFLSEGSDLLRDFPREKQATPEDIAKVDDWEKRVVRFLGRCPDQFSTTLFLSDYPEVPVAGGAQGGNWRSLKKLSRRLATLRQFIDELRRG